MKYLQGLGDLAGSLGDLAGHNITRIYFNIIHVPACQ